MINNNCSILSSNLLTPSDIEEHGTIERWRSREKLKARHDKFSSTHHLTLNQQIHDKVFLHNQEENLSKAYARDTAKHRAIIHLLEMRQEHDRQKLLRDINTFRSIHQQRKDAREYDIVMPTITDNNYTQYGPGSCLFFEGEDRNKNDREKKQKEQMNQWIIEQCREKNETIQEQQKLDDIYHSNQLLIAERIKNLEAIQIMSRRQLEHDIQLFNRCLANQKQNELEV